VTNGPSPLVAPVQFARGKQQAGEPDHAGQYDRRDDDELHRTRIEMTGGRLPAGGMPSYE